MFRLVLAAALAGLVAGCGSSGTKADKASVASIQSVAVIAFSVPKFVTEEAGGGSLAGVSAMVTAARQIGSGGIRGNGADVARDAAPTFVEEMGKQSNARFMTMNQVLGNSEFRALVPMFDQSRAGQGSQKAAFEGFPVIVLTPSMDRSEFAARAAKALGVDGVVMVDFTRLNYILYTGVAGSGQAKARGAALFKMFDKNGRAVWESSATVNTDASAGMVAGGINPAAGPALHKDLGAVVARDLQKSLRGS